MFIQTEETPNPATMKFLPGREVMGHGTLEITDVQGGGESSPLAKSLFGIEGVSGVFFSRDFITVTKAANKDWPVLKPPILTTIMEHFTNNRPVVNESDGEATAAIPAALSMKMLCQTDPRDHRHQGPARRGAGWRRHYLPELRRWRGLSPPQRLMRRMPERDPDTQSRDRKHAETLCAGS